MISSQAKKIATWSDAEVLRATGALQGAAHPLEKLATLNQRLIEIAEFEKLDRYGIVNAKKMQNYKVVDFIGGANGGTHQVQVLLDGQIAAGGPDAVLRTWSHKSNPARWSSICVEKDGHGAIGNFQYVARGKVFSCANGTTINEWVRENDGWACEPVKDSLFNYPFHALPNGRLIVADSAIRIFDKMEDGKWGFRISADEIYSSTQIQGLPNGNILATGKVGSAGMLAIWELDDSGNYHRKVLGSNSMEGFTMQGYPDGRILSVANQFGVDIYKKNEQNNWVQESFCVKQGNISGIQGLADGRILVSTYNGRIYEWEKFEGGNWRDRTLIFHNEAITSFRALEDGTIVTGGASGATFWKGSSL